MRSPSSPQRPGSPRVGRDRRCRLALGQLLVAGPHPLSWRLILAPPDVRRFVVAHEVAHSSTSTTAREFKALEARLYGPGLAGRRPRYAAWGRGSGESGGAARLARRRGRLRLALAILVLRLLLWRERLVELLLARVAGAVGPDHRLLLRMPAGAAVPIGIPFSSTIGATPFMS